MIRFLKNFWPRQVVSASLRNMSFAWHYKHRWVESFFILSPLYWAVITVRRFLYRHNIFKVTQVPATVIVVGNITVGGTGKTPFVIWLAKLLASQGYKPGIVSRGYGGKAKQYPVRVTEDSLPATVGDEPLLLARHSGCPVVVAPNRVQAAQQLLAEHDCDIIISDDGLQHYALARQLEIVLVDDEFGFGNESLLPGGPLREPMSRLKSVDFCFRQGRSVDFYLKPIQFVSVQPPHNALPLSALAKQKIHGIAGIGNPKRFFNTLRALDIDVMEHAFLDHHVFTAHEIDYPDAAIVMTEKDAVKCQSFTTKQPCWYLQVEAEVRGSIPDQLLTAVKKCVRERHGQEIA